VWLSLSEPAPAAAGAGDRVLADSLG
jgi:hypothetical protein